MEELIYKGTTYRRYPESKNSSDRLYFRSTGWGGRPKLLHREVWKEHHGRIPKGYHVHHKDGDSTNNDISNLECISSAEHHASHSEERSIRGKAPKQLKHLEEVRELTKEWHASKAGHEWHKAHYQKSMAKLRKKVPTKCVECGKDFMVDILCLARTKFCGGTCRARDLRRRYRAAGRPLSVSKARSRI